jgi:signal transduction histidine kinase/ActR/RegA family two-component response regulator
LDRLCTEIKTHLKATASKFMADATLRRSAEQRLRALPHPAAKPSMQELRSAVEELHVYDAELQIQNEELVASRAQIEESQKKYFRHFDLAPVGLLRLNRAGLILDANILAAQMLDVNRALLHSGRRPFLAHLAPGALAVFEQHLESALASGKMEMCELQLRSADGRTAFVRMQSVISRGEPNLPEFYITLTDLTERREIEKKLELQKILAEAAVASKDLFFAMLSHELRTPLTPLVALLEDLGADRRRSPEDLDAFAIMRRNLDLETHLIDDLLDVTRITSGKIQLHRETIDVHRCLQGAIAICQAEIDGKGLQLAFQPAAARSFVDGDASRLQQVFWNLIKNAVKFTPSGGRIAIETRCEENDLIVQFSDTGIGIDEWPLGHIFDPFFQVQLSIKQRGSGLGLGLAICKGILEAHGGSLSAASSGLGKGTTFRLRLTTVAKPDPGARAPGTDTAVPARRENLRLLLVEDHDDTREVLARLLTRRGYNVAPARNAQEARALCREKSFDLLVGDIALPDGTGCELLEELSAKYGLQGIAMSGFGSDYDLDLSKAAGFLEHLVKPIDATALDAAIQRVAGISAK